VKISELREIKKLVFCAANQFIRSKIIKNGSLNFDGAFFIKHDEVAVLHKEFVAD